jgi:hypothetical protein
LGWLSWAAAKLRTIIRRLLAMYNYPPDAEAKAIELVSRQMGDRTLKT